MVTKITDSLWRGPRPKDLADLKADGFDRCVSLQSGFEDLVTDSKLEYEDPFDFQITLHNLDWSNVFPPSAQQVLRLLSIVRDGTKLKTLIHCHSGVDRTGFAAAIIRMRLQKWSFDAAHDEFVQMGRHWWFWWWKHELRKWRGDE